MKGFGIGIVKYAAAHEAQVRAQLADPETAGEDLEAMLDKHLIKIGWLQHERLVHLLVTMLFALILIILTGILLMTPPTLPLLILTGLMAVILAAYVIHYFQLENCVQRWYKLADDIMQRMRSEEHWTQLSG